eukprot:jgi/Mesen1/705/ME000109S_10918
MAFPSSCSSIDCAVRYAGLTTLDSVVDFVTRTVLHLPRVPRISAANLERSFLARTPVHKVSAVLVLPAQQRVPPTFRLAARQFARFFSFKVVDYTARDARTLKDRLLSYGVKRAPTLVIFKEPDTSPVLHSGSMRKGRLWDVLKQHRLHGKPVATCQLDMARHVLGSGCLLPQK